MATGSSLQLSFLSGGAGPACNLALFLALCKIIEVRMAAPFRSENQVFTSLGTREGSQSLEWNEGEVLFMSKHLAGMHDFNLVPGILLFPF